MELEELAESSVSLAGKATKGEPGAATAGMLRADVAGVEVQVATICGSV